MSYNIINKTKQPLVCTLADRSTLRITIEGSKIINETQMNDYLRTLETKGLVVIKEVEEKVTKKPKNTTEN